MKFLLTIEFDDGSSYYQIIDNVASDNAAKTRRDEMLPHIVALHKGIVALHKEGVKVQNTTLYHVLHVVN